MKNAILSTVIAMALLVPAPSMAQGMDPIWLGQGAVGQSAIQNGINNSRRAGVPQRNTRASQRHKVQQSRNIACSPDSFPAAERRKLNAEVAQIIRRKGQAAGVAHARKVGIQYRKRLQAQGICPKG